MSQTQAPANLVNDMDTASHTNHAGVSMGGYGPSTNKVAPVGDSFDETMHLMNQPRYQKANARTFRGLERRLVMIKEAGLPPMRVLTASKLEELGRIPRSTEGHAVDALEELRKHRGDLSNNVRAPIIFFSHRWERPNYCAALNKDLLWGTEERNTAMGAGHTIGDPDTDDCRKASALIEWVRWFKWAANDGQFLDISDQVLEVLIFIDYACVDQTNPMPEIAALPAFVSASTAIASYWTDEYEGRAWCRAELIVAYGFAATGEKVWCVHPGFKHKKQKRLTKDTIILPDPMTGYLTNEGERPIILRLRDCAMTSQAFTCARMCWHTMTESAIRCMVVGVCMCCGCFGLAAYGVSRSVQPGRSSVALVKALDNG